MKYESPRGVFDILPTYALRQSNELFRASELWQEVEAVIRQITRHFGFLEVRTPVFERTELFTRSVGENTDIVSKEMYSFEDRGNRHLTLRPEGTAPVMRAFLEGHLNQALPEHKLFYMGPMFRYERPQAGRYRQHHQFGAEAIGNGSPEQDAEIIDLLYTVFRELGLSHLGVYLNSLGSPDCRKKYRKALLDYLSKHKDDLSEESKRRFENNPLRVLDSKDSRDREIVADAPVILDHLNKDSQEHFEQVQRRLDQLGIPFTVNNTLVRGLDYYNKTVFEVVSGELGAQNSVGGGGRYDGLIDLLGGPDLPAIGFGTGIERILQTLIQQKPDCIKQQGPFLFLIPLGEAAKTRCFDLLHNMRRRGVSTQMDFSGRKLGKVMAYADNVKAELVAVIGDQELENDEVEIKGMATGEKVKLKLSTLIEEMLTLLAIREQRRLNEIAEEVSKALGIDSLQQQKDAEQPPTQS